MVFTEAQPPFLSNKSVSGISPWKPVELRSRWKEALRWPRGTQQPPGGSSSPLAASRPADAEQALLDSPPQLRDPSEGY